MIIWGAVLIPILTVLVLGLKYSKRILWWQYFVALALPTLIIWGIKSGCEVTSSTTEEAFKTGQDNDVKLFNTSTKQK
jgi:hypothetical protein